MKFCNTDIELRIPVHQKMRKIIYNTSPVYGSIKTQNDPGFRTVPCNFRAVKFNYLAPTEYYLYHFGQSLSRNHLIGHWAASGLVGLGSGIQTAMLKRG